MKLCWITLVLLLGFIISVPINGDTYHYRVIRVGDAYAITNKDNSTNQGLKENF